MTEPLDMSAQAPFLDAIALVNAQQRRDGDSVERILDAAYRYDDGDRPF